MKKYFRVWKQLAVMASESYFSNRIEYGSYFLGKVIRFGFFWLMVFSIFGHVSLLNGYTRNQVLVFLLTSFLTDNLGQALFRGVYLFKDDVRKGNADYIISKPINFLFYVMTRLTDILDTIFVGLLLIPLIYVFIKIGAFSNLLDIAAYLLFVLLALVILAAIHIISAAFTVWTVESESFIWLFRNSMFASLFPPEIFSNPIQFIFTFVLPVIVVVAVPSKALLGFLTFKLAIISFAVAIVFFSGSLLLWKASLKSYSSASS